jgi:hypothetical protein
MKEPSEMSLLELFDRFEKDIRYGCHSLRAEVSRSQAGMEIQKRSATSLPEIEAYAKAKSGLPDDRVLLGWAMLLRWIREEVSA